MPPFPFAWAEGDAPATLALRCLADLEPLPDGDGVLGLVYASGVIGSRLDEALDALRASLPRVTWIGTVGDGLAVTGREVYDAPALAVMLADLAPGSFQLVAPDGDRLPGEIGRWLAGREGAFALMHGDPTDAATPLLLSQLAQEAGVGFVNGGLSASTSAHVQVAGEVRRGGLSGVLIDPSVAILTDHTQGCTPLGPVHALSEVQRNIAVRLDGRPALDVLREDVGEVIARDLQRMGGYIFAALPVPRTDTGDYLVRNLVGIDPQRGLVAVGDDLEGQESLMFCRRDGNSAREDLERMLDRLRRRLDGRVPRGGVYVSCVGRGRHQFGDRSEELRAIRDGLGEFPLVGFFANGEIYNGRLYGYTGVLTLFVD
ncbi:MAG: FIST C-terminal domain-containing protein [Gammaproteobacteria bacterium]|nr:FIST C-terminal domain-containing protein [Gammaproteobacteria bacterium]